MSVDVEDYYQVAAFDKVISTEQWGSFESRVARSTGRVLEIFEKRGVKATFFTLGCVAEQNPQIVSDIVSAGHELASHGFAHQKADRQTREEFFEDITRAKELLENISGKQIVGYRAPSFSISEKNEWAFDELKRAGHLYSSSTYPVVHDHYGTPNWPKTPYFPVEGLLELPQATIEKLGRTLPVGGGGYFRLFPYQLSKYFIKQFQQNNDHPYIFYFHPWEIDAGQPVIKGAGAKSQFRHRVNLSKMDSKIDALSRDFEWTSIADAFGIEV